MADYTLNNAWSDIDAVAAAYKAGALVEKRRLYNPTERDILPVSAKSDGSLWSRSAMVYSFNSMSEYDELTNEEPDRIKNGDHVWISSKGLNNANVYTLYLYFQQGLNKAVEIVSGTSTGSGEGNDTGKDAVIWYTNVAPTSHRFVIVNLRGPAGAVPYPGHMIVSGYTGRGYFITAADNDAVTIADYSVQVTGNPGPNGQPGQDGQDGGYYTIDVEQLNSQNAKLSFTPSKEGMEAIPPEVVTLPQGPQGNPGARGTGLLPITTEPSSYTTAVNGLTAAYRISLETVKSQAGVSEVFAGDTLCHSYYHYPVIYVDDTYVYCRASVSVRGSAGADAVIWHTNVAPSSNRFVIADLNGPAGEVPAPGHMIVSSYTGLGYFITASDGSAVTVSSDTVQVTGPKGDTGPQGPQGATPVRGTDYWTAADIAQIKAYVDEAILGGAW